MFFVKVLIISGDVSIDECHIRMECCEIIPQVLLGGLDIDIGTGHDDLVHQLIHYIRLIHTVAVLVKMM